jgi:hypothetical protein
MDGATPPLPCKPSWRALEQLYLHLIFIQLVSQGIVNYPGYLNQLFIVPGFRLRNWSNVTVQLLISPNLLALLFLKSKKQDLFESLTESTLSKPSTVSSNCCYIYHPNSTITYLLPFGEFCICTSRVWRREVLSLLDPQIQHIRKSKCT